MPDQPEVILSRIRDTQSSLVEKLEILENRVAGTVTGATEAVNQAREAVTNTVKNVAETVDETVESVKSAFNIVEHVRRNPWLAVGGAVAVGFFGYHLVHGLGNTAGSATQAGSSMGEGVVARVVQDYAGELKSLALTTALGFARANLPQILPDALRGSVLDWLDNMNSRFGGSQGGLQPATR